MRELLQGQMLTQVTEKGINRALRLGLGVVWRGRRLRRWGEEVGESELVLAGVVLLAVPGGAGGGCGREGGWRGKRNGDDSVANEVSDKGGTGHVGIVIEIRLLTKARIYGRPIPDG